MKKIIQFIKKFKPANNKIVDAREIILKAEINLGLEISNINELFINQIVKKKDIITINKDFEDKFNKAHVKFNKYFDMVELEKLSDNSFGKEFINNFLNEKIDLSDMKLKVLRTIPRGKVKINEKTKISIKNLKDYSKYEKLFDTFFSK